MSEMPVGNPEVIHRYYRFHAGIYDVTRWTFLFGRRRLIQRLVQESDPRSILEIGCGTGVNLARLARAFPGARLTGIDISPQMLQRARRATAFCGDRVSFIEQPYQGPLKPEGGFDLIVCSYSLSMINPGWQQVLAGCREDLSPGGRLAVVDFNNSAYPWFRRWMGVNHVSMDGQLLSALDRDFSPQLRESGSAYGGLWEYILVIAST